MPILSGELVQKIQQIIQAGKERRGIVVTSALSLTMIAFLASLSFSTDYAYSQGTIPPTPTEEGTPTPEEPTPSPTPQDATSPTPTVTPQALGYVSLHVSDAEGNGIGSAVIDVELPDGGVSNYLSNVRGDHMEEDLTGSGTYTFTVSPPEEEEEGVLAATIATQHEIAEVEYTVDLSPQTAVNSTSLEVEDPIGSQMQVEIVDTSVGAASATGMSKLRTSTGMDAQSNLYAEVASGSSSVLVHGIESGTQVQVGGSLQEVSVSTVNGEDGFQVTFTAGTETMVYDANPHDGMTGTTIAVDLAQNTVTEVVELPTGDVTIDGSDKNGDGQISADEQQVDDGDDQDQSLFLPLVIR